jgi:hypothetical protein
MTVENPKEVWKQIRTSKAQEMTITKGTIHVGRKKFNLQGRRGNDRLYGFGKSIRDIGIEYDSDKGLIGFTTRRDPGIRIVVTMRTDTVAELVEIKKLFYGNINIPKRKHIMSASRKRGEAPAEDNNQAAAPPPPPITPPPKANTPAPPTVPAAPTAAPAPPTSEAPPAPTPPPPKTPPAPEVKEEEEVTAEEVEEVTTDAEEQAPEEVEEASEEVTEEEEAEVTYLRDKAPLKSEHNSADKLKEKGWSCIPHVYEDLTLADIQNALYELDNLRDVYMEALYIVASKGTVTDEQRVEIAIQAVAEFKKKLANL